ncbi:hypothetical protein ES703_78889 [subsurface metagenome]
MGIESPRTYADFYWAKQVEAEKLFQDELEQEVSGYVASMFDSLGIRDVVPESFSRFVDTMTSGKSFAWGGILARFGSEMADSVLSQTLGHALKDFNYMMAEKFHDTRINSAMACTLYQRKNIDDTMWAARMLAEGYDLPEAIHAYGASLPYPTVADLMLYTRYHDEGKTSRDEVWRYFDVPADEFPIWEWLTFQRLTTLQAQALYKRDSLSNTELFTELAKIGWSAADRPFIEDLSFVLPNAMLLTQGNLQQAKSRTDILADISRADIHPKYAQTYLDAILTKPSSQDLIAYHLRKDPELSALPADLRKIGIHDNYIDVYKTLAYPIPPVADIITMAVREAFTPSIAAKFGQYEDYPPEFEEWALKKGLSVEWSKRYWAAHWSLPSASQGFEMLHRGVIGRGELDMLLRALDIMPFWRDKLTGIAFRRLSRVDIRRMYNVGVMSEKEVYDAYLELGYNERDARRMSDFTVKQVLKTQSKFTTADVISGYAKYMITRSEASSLLLDIGVRSENISFILTSADYKRDWKLTDDRIAAIRNLYKKEVYSPDTARGELLRLDLPAQRVDVLMEQWYIDEKDKPPRHWTTAQTLSFIKEGLITKDRGVKELQDIGYDSEHINIYLKASE